MADPAVLNRFDVTVDGLDLGSFTDCKGLKVTYKFDDLAEGGALGATASFLKAVAYNDITLVRPLNARSPQVAAWFSRYADKPEASTARISAMDPSGAEICAWDLQGVVPKEWVGPEFSAAGGGAARETLVLGHTGFTTGGGG
jgi:phage tail-like protein